VKLHHLATFSEWLRREKAISRMSYRELGEITGITPGYINHLCTGRVKAVGRQTVIALARALGADTAEPLLLADHAPESYWQLLSWARSEELGEHWTQGQTEAINAAWTLAMAHTRKPGEGRTRLPEGHAMVGVDSRYRQVREVERRLRRTFLPPNLWDLI